jgi:hypothetical protein
MMASIVLQLLFDIIVNISKLAPAATQHATIVNAVCTSRFSTAQAIANTMLPTRTKRVYKDWILP